MSVTTNQNESAANAKSSPNYSPTDVLTDKVCREQKGDYLVTTIQFLKLSLVALLHQLTLVHTALLLTFNR